MMSTSVVVQNLYYFFRDVLQKAYLDSSWDAQDLERGFQWAAYCEQIYQRVCDKPRLQDELEAILKQMSSHPSLSALPSPLQLKHLGNATEIFQAALLQNRFISPEILHTVASKVKDKKVLSDVQALKSGLANIITFLKKQKHGCAPNGWHTDPWQALEVELHREHVKNLLLQHPKPDEFKNYLLSSLDSLETSSRNLVTMLLMAADFECHQQNVNENLKVKTLIFDTWLMKKLDSDDAEFQQTFWSLPPSLLCHVATKYPPFYEAYTSQLIRHSEKLEYEQTGTGWRWKVQEESSSNFCLQFEDVVRHFSVLLENKDHAKKASQLMQNLCTSKRERLWKDISEACRTLSLYREEQIPSMADDDGLLSTFFEVNE